MELEDEADGAVAKGGKLRRAEPRHILLVDEDLALRRHIERSDDVQERRLARPRGAKHRYHFSWFDNQINATQDHDGLAAEVVRLA